MTATPRTTALVLGAMFFGTTIDEDTSFQLLDHFVARGGQWIDTADCYSFWASPSGQGGDSEAVLGRWLAARPGVREQIKIATKLGAEPSWAGSWADHRTGLTRRAIRQAFRGSLARLGVDAVDLLWLHMEDRRTPIEQTVDAMSELVESGTVDRLGASNHPAWLVERARAHALARGSIPIDALQLNTSYLQVRPGTRPPGVAHRFWALDDEHRDYADVHGLEVWAYSPLISGSYDNPAKQRPEVYNHPGTDRRLAALGEVAAETGLSRSQVVLSWLIANGIRPILGGSKLDQLDLALDAAEHPLSPEQCSRLSEAV